MGVTLNMLSRLGFPKEKLNISTDMQEIIDASDIIISSYTFDVSGASG